MADQNNIQIGTVFAGDFKVVRALTAGGMGAVYVAEQVSTGKPRALKVMLPSLVADPALRKRFEQEARIGSLIESEHVVEVVGAGVDQQTGLPWLAMELLQGEELAQVVEARGPLPVQDVLVIFEQLCHAVGAAHRVGVVHRDLKPENIFLAQARRAGASYMVKVLDFGIAKIVAEASTKQTAAMGSPIWMAPEQADQSPITPGTDVWALGLIAFYLLTGRPFWRSANDDNATIPQVLKEVLFEPIVPASTRMAELGRSLPPGFDAWFARCVAREPHARFPDASQAGAALAAALGAGGSAGMPVSVLAPTGYAMSPASAYAQSSPTPHGAQAPAGLSGSGPVGYPAPQPQGPWTPPAGTGPTGVAPGMMASAAVAGTGGTYTLPTAPATGTNPPLPTPPRRSGTIVAGVALAFVAIAAVGGALWWKHAKPGASLATGGASTAQPAAAASGQPSPDMELVLDAKQLSDQGKFNAAHERVGQLAAESPARQSQEFKDVEFKWASETLLLADRTSDVAQKRRLLEVVAQSSTVDETLRTSARDHLAALDATTDAGGTKTHVTQAGFRGVGGSSKPEAVVVLTNQAEPTAPIATAVPAAPPATPPPTRSVYDLANSTTSADWWVARRILEPKVQGGTATLEEAHLLQQICKNQHDKPCQKECSRALSGKR